MRNVTKLSGFQVFLKNVVPYAAIFGILLAMICLIPNCKVRFISGVIGAAVGTVGVAILGYAFKFVVSHGKGT